MTVISNAGLQSAHTDKLKRFLGNVISIHGFFPIPDLEICEHSPITFRVKMDEAKLLKKQKGEEENKNYENKNSWFPSV